MSDIVVTGSLFQTLGFTVINHQLDVYQYLVFGAPAPTPQPKVAPIPPEFYTYINLHGARIGIHKPMSELSAEEITILDQLAVRWFQSKQMLESMPQTAKIVTELGPVEVAVVAERIRDTTFLVYPRDPKPPVLGQPTSGQFKNGGVGEAEFRSGVPIMKVGMDGLSDYMDNKNKGLIYVIHEAVHMTPLGMAIEAKYRSTESELGKAISSGEFDSRERHAHGVTLEILRVNGIVPLPSDQPDIGPAMDAVYSDTGSFPYISYSIGSDVVTGTSSSDYLYAMGGSDTITGGTGNDILVGGVGDDSYHFSRGHGVDIVRDNGTYDSSITDTDSIVFGPDIHPNDLRITYDPNTNGLMVSVGGTKDKIIIAGQFNNTDKDEIESFYFESTGQLWGSPTIYANMKRSPALNGSDFNNDGYGDILWRNNDGTVTTWDGKAQGYFVSSEISTPSGLDWQVVGTGNFDGISGDDVLWRRVDGDAHTWVSQGPAHALSSNTLASFKEASLDWDVAGTANVNGDYYTDVLWRNNDGRFTTWMGGYDGNFDSNTVIYSVSTDWVVRGSGDFNEDGNSDILWRNTATGIVAWWAADYNGLFTPQSTEYAAPANWSIMGVGDFNGDRYQDILWRNTSGQVDVWFSGPSGFTPRDDYEPAPLDWVIEDISDYNGDTLSDILWRNSSSGIVDTWMGVIDGSFIISSRFSPASLDWQIQGTPEFTL